MNRDDQKNKRRHKISEKYLLLVTLLLTLGAAGCGSSQPANVSTEAVTESSSEPVTGGKKRQPVGETTTEAAVETTAETTADASAEFLRTLAGYEYYFASGIGAWGTGLEIEADGTFEADYHDSNMGESGEGYPYGTIYVSEVSGRFTDLYQVDEYTWKMTLDQLEYEETIGKTEYEEGVRYIYSECYGIDEGRNFTVYLAGTPIDRLDDDIMTWLYEEEGTYLSKMILVNDDYGSVFRSYIPEDDDEMEDDHDHDSQGTDSKDSSDAYQEARDIFNSYQDAYKLLQEDFNEDGNDQSTLNRIASDMYKTADNCINEIWPLMKRNLDVDTYQKVLKEQQEWIQEKEEKGTDIQAEYEGGSMMSMVYGLELGQMTMDRCEVLIEYLKN